MNRHCFYFILLLFVAIGCQEESTPATSEFENAPANPDQQLLLELVNTARTSGMTCSGQALSATTAVTWNDILTAVAKAHSEDMNQNDFFGHEGSDGFKASTRVLDAGYDFVTVKENLAKGQSTEAAVVQAWLESSGHCENIMSADVTEMGVGTSGPYWTMVLASE